MFFPAPLINISIRLSGEQFAENERCESNRRYDSDGYGLHIRFVNWVLITL